MSPREQREHWMQICNNLRHSREGGNVDLHKVADLAEKLLPHWPSFDYTLRLISQKLRAQPAL